MKLGRRGIVVVITALATTIWVALIILGTSLSHSSSIHNASAVNQLPDFAATSAPMPSESTPAQQSLVGTLTVPSAQVLALPITRGVDKATLNTGMAGSYPWSGPGQNGVFTLAAHRVGSGGPFRYLDQVHIGDRLFVETAEQKFTYRVISTEVVDPTQTSVLNGPKDESRIVLITCTPLDTFKQRIVVTAQLIPDAK